MSKSCNIAQADLEVGEALEVIVRDGLCWCLRVRETRRVS